MDDARRAMATWVGTLARGGLLQDAHEEQGVAAACAVVGEERLSALREWMALQDPSVVRREQKAAIEVCIWMAHADRTVDEHEVEVLHDIVLASDLDQDDRDELVAAIDDPPSLADVEERLTHPTLRELIFGLAWELALVDGRVADAERDLSDGLARRLDLSPKRAQELRKAVAELLRA